MKVHGTCLVHESSYYFYGMNFVNETSTTPPYLEHL